MALLIYPLIHSQTKRCLPFQKGWVSVPLQGYQTLAISSKTWMLSKEELDFSYFSLDPIRVQQKGTPNQGYHLNTILQTSSNPVGPFQLESMFYPLNRTCIIKNMEIQKRKILQRKNTKQ